MQRDVKLGLGVGVVLLLLCGFFYIKMKSAENESGIPTATTLEQIHGTQVEQTEEIVPDRSLELPKQVTPPPIEPDVASESVSPKEAETFELPPPVPVVPTKKEDEPEPNAVVKLGPIEETVEQKVKEIKTEKKAQEKEEQDPGTRPDFPFIPPPTVPKSDVPTVARAGGEYVVVSGDTLSGIAAEMLGSARHWRKLYEANKDKLPTPRSLMVGMTLVLPEITEEPRAEKPEKPALAPPVEPDATMEGDVHVVEKGETLSDIAEQHLGDRNKWKTIANANPQINPNRLRIGQKIRIPQR